MKQYFIGINRISKEVLFKLLDLGGTLMFRHHYKTVELNEIFGFYDGKWMFYTDVQSDDSGIKENEAYLDTVHKNDEMFKYEIVFH